MKYLSFSIIIPVAKDENYSSIKEAIKKIIYPKNKIEIIIIFGNQPSKQRNIAAQKAKGDILYFLDNDSTPSKENLNILNTIFQNPDNVIAGGPSLSKNNDSSFQKTVGNAFGSFIGSAQSRSRYNTIGDQRESNELELILCNMAIRRKTFQKLKGFNPKLYPNEENELINRVKKEKGHILYDPTLKVFRSHRKNLLLFIKQIFIYGRGRGEQVYLNISDLTLFPIISLGFNIYLILLIFYTNIYFFIPAFIYLFIISLASLYISINQKKIISFFLLPVIFFLTHFCYGTGFLFGLIKFLFKIQKRKEKFWYQLKWLKKM